MTLTVYVINRRGRVSGYAVRYCEVIILSLGEQNITASLKVYNISLWHNYLPKRYHILCFEPVEVKKGSVRGTTPLTAIIH